MLKSLIIDDEKLSRSLLRNILSENCAEVDVIGEAANFKEASSLIHNLNPDLVFLDIELSSCTGFDLLNSNEHSNSFQTIFVTAYKQYAIDAIKAGAADYILKPINVGELKAAVQKVYFKFLKKNTNDAIVVRESDRVLLVPYLHGIKILKVENIIYLQADNNYTTIYLNDKTKLVASKTLKDFENKLDKSVFFRTHKSYIINLDYCREISFKDGSYVVLSNEIHVPVSRHRLNDFHDTIGKFTHL